MTRFQELVGRINWLPVVTVLLGLGALVLLALDRREDAGIVALVCIGSAVLSRAE